MGKNNIKFTYEEVKEYVESYEFELLSENYVRALNKLTFRCKNGHVFERTFAKFKTNKKCPYCDGIRKWKYSEVKDYINNNGYELLSSEYENMFSKIKLKCEKGHIYNTTFNDFKNNGTRCPHCAGNIKHNYDYVKTYIEKFGYTLLSNEYINAKTKLKLSCSHGHIFQITFANFKTGYRCPKCSIIKQSESMKFSYCYVKDYIEKYGYELLSEDYVNCKTKLRIKCNEGHEFNMTFDNFKNGTRCPKCKSSKGEVFIINYLKNNGFVENNDYIYNKCYFKNLLSPKGNRLRPDFILPKERIWIGYDGEQHFKPIEAFGGMNSFIDIKINDTIKNYYAENNNWKLIRIPYWDFNIINNILEKELKIS